MSEIERPSESGPVLFQIREKIEALTLIHKACLPPNPKGEIRASDLDLDNITGSSKLWELVKKTKQLIEDLVYYNLSKDECNIADRLLRELENIEKDEALVDFPRHQTKMARIRVLARIAALEGKGLEDLEKIDTSRSLSK